MRWCANLDEMTVYIIDIHFIHLNFWKLQYDIFYKYCLSLQLQFLKTLVRCLSQQWGTLGWHTLQRVTICIVTIRSKRLCLDNSDERDRSIWYSKLKKNNSYALVVEVLYSQQLWELTSPNGWLVQFSLVLILCRAYIEHQISGQTFARASYTVVS